MSDQQKPCSLLEEIDERQDDVLAQLDELNSRIENLLRECLQNRTEELELAEV